MTPEPPDRQTRNADSATSAARDPPHARRPSDTARAKSETLALLAQLTPWWWGGAILFFGIGDIVTTLVGLRLEMIVEASPVGAWLVETYGPTAIIPIKSLLLGGFYGLWLLLPRPQNTGIPLALCALGLLITVWNTAVLIFLTVS